MAAGRLGRVTPASALNTDTWHWTPASPVHSGKQWGQISLCASVYLLHMLRGHLLTLSSYPPFFPTVHWKRSLHYWWHDMDCQSKLMEMNVYYRWRCIFTRVGVVLLLSLVPCQLRLVNIMLIIDQSPGRASPPRHGALLSTGRHHHHLHWMQSPSPPALSTSQH